MSRLPDPNGIPQKKPCAQHPRLSSSSNSPAVSLSSFVSPSSTSIVDSSTPKGVKCKNKALACKAVPKELLPSRSMITPDFPARHSTAWSGRETLVENPVFACLPPPPKKLRHSHPADSPSLPVEAVVMNSKARPCKTSQKAVPNLKQPRPHGISGKTAAFKSPVMQRVVSSVNDVERQEPFGCTLPGELARSIIANMNCFHVGTTHEPAVPTKQADATAPVIPSLQDGDG